eukprot:SM000413S15643  [mRNA]  locus=s413:6883:9263:+ [translate_table: standard]
MFFAPALLALAAARAAVHVLCLSTGGKVEAAEAPLWCGPWQVPEENVCVLDHPELQDGFQEAWSVALIRYLVEEALSSKDINVILTFDKYGVSGHPNHRAVHGGVRSLVLQQRGKFATNVASDTSSLEAWELRENCSCSGIDLFLLVWYAKAVKVGMVQQVVADGLGVLNFDGDGKGTVQEVTHPTSTKGAYLRALTAFFVSALV